MSHDEDLSDDAVHSVIEIATNYDRNCQRIESELSASECDSAQNGLNLLESNGPFFGCTLQMDIDDECKSMFILIAVLIDDLE